MTLLTVLLATLTLTADPLRAPHPPTDPAPAVCLPAVGCASAVCTAGWFYVICAVQVNGHGCAAECSLHGCDGDCDAQIPGDAELPVVDYAPENCIVTRAGGQACAACEVDRDVIVCGFDLDGADGSELACGLRCDDVGCVGRCAAEAP